MTAQEIIFAIIENNNRNPTSQKIELKKEIKGDFIQIEYGNNIVVKEYSQSMEKEIDFEHLEKRCYQRLLDFIVEQSIKPYPLNQKNEVAENRN
jgi:hypothetical protein